MVSERESEPQSAAQAQASEANTASPLSRGSRRFRLGASLRRRGAWWMSIAALALALPVFLLAVPRIGSLQSEAARRLQAIEQQLADLQSADQPMRAELRELRDRIAVLERRGLD